jgi:ribosomal-protein-serine acetyltransferase
MFRLIVDDEVDLRLLEERHAEALYALTDQNRQQLRRWLVWVDRTNSPADSAAFIRNGLYQFSNSDGFQAGIWFKDQLAGGIGFHYWDWNNRKTEIGYWLGATFQGQGVMTRACRAMVDYAFGELGLNRVQIRCARDNARSRAIPLRLGFTEEGALRQAEWLIDHFEDQIVYGILAEEWRQGRRAKTS